MLEAWLAVPVTRGEALIANVAFGALSVIGALAWQYLVRRAHAKAIARIFGEE